MGATYSYYVYGEDECVSKEGVEGGVEVVNDTADSPAEVVNDTADSPAEVVNDTADSPAEVVNDTVDSPAEVVNNTTESVDKEISTLEGEIKTLEKILDTTTENGIDSSITFVKKPRKRKRKNRKNKTLSKFKNNNQIIKNPVQIPNWSGNDSVPKWAVGEYLNRKRSFA